MNIHVDAKTAPAVQLDESGAEGLSKGERTRERLLDLAYESVIRKGFAATSIEELVEAVGITKSGFFYHFRDKNDLALNMLERYFAGNGREMDQLAARATELIEDPLHAYLAYLKLWAELLGVIAVERPGCIVAVVAFQERAFDPAVRNRNRDGVLAWRARTRQWLDRIAETYPPQAEVDIDALSDTMTALGIGGLAISQAVKEPHAAQRQVLLYRELVRQIFQPR